MSDGGRRYTFECLSESGGLLREPRALPGGRIFVPAGLFSASESEAELVGVLAHSMAHAEARHGVRMATRGELANVSSIPLDYLAPRGGWHGTESALPFGFLRLMRGFELEADRIAVSAMARAGYDPNALFRFIARMQVDDGRESFRSRPPREARLAAFREAIADLPPSAYDSWTGQFERIRAVVAALTGL